MKSKGIGIFLLLSIVLPTLLGLAYLEWRREVVREHAQQLILKGLPEEELAVLSFTDLSLKQEVIWKDKREFLYRGEMYDLVRSERSGNHIELYCWHDRQESELNGKQSILLEALIGSNVPLKKKSSQLAHVFHSLALPEHFDFKILPLVRLTYHSARQDDILHGFARSCWHPPSRS